MASGDYRQRGECGGTGPSERDHLVGDNPGLSAPMGGSPFTSLSDDLRIPQPRDGIAG
jgi:hypothetical protein